MTIDKYAIKEVKKKHQITLTKATIMIMTFLSCQTNGKEKKKLKTVNKRGNERKMKRSVAAIH